MAISLIRLICVLIILISVQVARSIVQALSMNPKHPIPIRPLTYAYIPPKNLAAITLEYQSIQRTVLGDVCGGLAAI